MPRTLTLRPRDTAEEAQGQKHLSAVSCRLRGAGRGCHGAVRGLEFSWFWFVLESGGTSLSAITGSARPGLGTARPGAL